MSLQTISSPVVGPQLNQTPSSPSGSNYERKIQQQQQTLKLSTATTPKREMKQANANAKAPEGPLKKPLRPPPALIPIPLLQGQGQNRNSTGKQEEARKINRTEDLRRQPMKECNSPDTGAGRRKMQDPRPDPPLEEERQCLALSCRRAARENSKYCSQACCVQLATDRLNFFMPERVKEWKKTQGLAEMKNEAALKETMAKIDLVLQERVEIEERREELEKYIERIENIKIKVEAGQLQNRGNEDFGGLLHCVSCGKEMPNNNGYLKHLEICFAKLESQRDFVSLFPPFQTPNGIPIFCDRFHQQDRTYCKRLRTICKHYKPAKITEGQICGYPLGKKFSESVDGFCTVLKKKCLKHFAWDRIRRAELDMERFNSLIKHDDLLCTARNLRTAKSRRGNLLDILLNRTKSHDPANPPKEVKEFQEKQRVEILKSPEAEEDDTEISTEIVCVDL